MSFLLGDKLCTCGHPRSEHYVYALNGRDQVRCRACDPTAWLPGGNYALDGATAEAYDAADHDFEPAPSAPIPMGLA